MIRLVVDANILFAALLKDGTTRRLLYSDKLELFAPGFLFEEAEKYRDFLAEKTGQPQGSIDAALEAVKRRVTVIPESRIAPLLEDAKKTSPARTTPRTGPPQGQRRRIFGRTTRY